MMQTQLKAFFNWSGGKDSSLSLYHIRRQKEYAVQWLLTSVNQDYNRVSMHGVRVDLLKRQAESIGLPLHCLLLPEKMSMETYNKTLAAACQGFVRQGIHYSIFGDIFLEDLRRTREEQLAQVSMQAVFPIWKRPTTELAREFIRLGFKAVIVCVQEKSLPRSFAGREFNQNLLNDLPPEVDPCGENGEFHTFVFDGPLFRTPVPFSLGSKVLREGFCFADLLPL